MRSVVAPQRVLQQVFDVGRRTYEGWRDDRTLRLGAGLAYYALFTVVPFLAVTAALAQPLLGSDEVRQWVADRLEAFGVVDSAAAARSITDRMDDGSLQVSLGLVGLVSLVFAASLLFVALGDAVNTIWDEPVRPGLGSTIRRRLLSFAMVLIASAAIVVQLAVAAIVGAASAIVPGDVAVIETLALALVSAASWAALAGLVVLLLRYLSPDRLSWRAAAAAGVPTAAAMVAATGLVGWYLRALGGESVTGAFGAILALLTWIYVEAQILLAGVQLSKALATRAAGTP